MLIDIHAGDVCEEGSFILYASQTTMLEFRTTISGTPFTCIGGQLAVFCDDDTWSTDPSYAYTLCTAFGFYGQ